MTEKTYICPQRTFTLWFRVPREDTVNGLRTLVPGLKAEFENFICRTPDEELQKEIEKSSQFESGFIKEFNPKTDKVPAPVIETGKKTTAKLTGRR
jgi:hypothetical protein